MKPFYPLLKIIGAVLLTVLFDSCKKDPSGPTTEPQQVNGAVQKGPFITGTSITVRPLDARLQPTGESYETQILNDLGHFMLPVKIDASYAELIAQGYYFNEVNGNLSNSPITLRSITRLSDGGNNINLLTTLEAARLRHLMTAKNKSFEEARRTAQNEVLAGFGITLKETQISDQLDISHAGEANAALLAVSAVMQSYRNEAELSELIAKISNDIRDNGDITQPELQNAIREGNLYANPENIRRNLIKRYAEAGAENVHIPDFYSYIDSDGDGQLNGAEPYIRLHQENLVLRQRGDTVSVSVHTNLDWNTEIPADASDWLFLDSKTTGDLLVLRASPNPGAARRAQLILKGKDSALADTLNILQAGNNVRLRLSLQAHWNPNSTAETIDPSLEGQLSDLTVIGFSPLNGKIMFKHTIQPVTDEALEFSVPYEDLSEPGHIIPSPNFFVIANAAESFRDFQGNSQDFREFRTTHDLNKMTGPLPLIGMGNFGNVSFTDVNKIPVTLGRAVAQITFEINFSSGAFVTEPEVVSVTVTGINSQRGRLYLHQEGIDTAYRNDYTMTKPDANGKYTFYNYDRASIEKVIIKVKVNGMEYTYTLTMRQTYDPTKPIIFMGGYSYNYRIQIDKTSISNTLQ